MKNDATNIGRETGDVSHASPEWKTKARAAGTAAWDATRATYEQLQEKTIQYSKATDRAIHEKPYVAIGAAFGVGLLLGYLVAGHSCSSNEEEG